ncbi:MAG: 4-(cytidine 5'-diphospho)-2-C-methyl-D-erythritol kinase [Bacteroidales bacterium]
MIVFPNAKINLGLHVVEKRTDGYHNLQTVFFPIPLFDVLEIVESSNEGLRLFNYGLTIDIPPQENICARAYQLIAERYHLPSLDIYLYKHIPFGAGLGGGSSDAAHTLLLLNKMFRLDIPFETLLEMALLLGSDCPFFLYNKAMYATGRGEVLQPIELNLSGKYLVVIKPAVHVSTAEAYKGVLPQRPAHDLREVLKLPVVEWKHYLSNDFEPSVFVKYPLLQHIKEQLYEMGALYAAMSGSGSALFGIFEGEVRVPASLTNYFVWAGTLP